MGSTEFSIQFRFEYIDDSVHQPVMEKNNTKIFRIWKVDIVSYVDNCFHQKIEESVNIRSLNF